MPGGFINLSLQIFVAVRSDVSAVIGYRCVARVLMTLVGSRTSVAHDLPDYGVAFLLVGGGCHSMDMDGSYWITEEYRLFEVRSG